MANLNNRIFIGLFLLFVFGCHQKAKTDEEITSIITTPEKICYWDIAGGDLMVRMAGKKSYFGKIEYTKRTGNYFYCHQFKSDGTMIEMSYDYSDSTLPRTQDWNGDIPTTQDWVIENGKFLLGLDTFDILKCDSDSFIVKSKFTSIVYVKSKRQ